MPIYSDTLLHRKDLFMNVLKLLASEGFITVNKEVIQKVGLHEAIMLGELCSKQQYWKDRKELTNDGYFFCTKENFENETTLSRYYQDKAIAKLENLGIVETKIIGLPARKYFRINENALEKLFY